MNIILCDDDNLIINELNSFIKQYFTEHNYPEPCIYSYSNGAELLASDKSADIIFLDIEMPGINGIITGKELKTMTRGNNLSELPSKHPNGPTKQKHKADITNTMNVENTRA